MFFTITIQTYNQAGRLRGSLGSLTALRCPAGVEYEVLVIDNASTDGTAGVIEEFRGSLGRRLRGLFEPRQGLSQARNLALREARGTVVCFLDDDALADPEWLAGHAAVYQKDPEAVAAGGRIELQWPADWTRPRWLAGALDSYLSGLDLGPEPLLMEYPRYPYGCNMSVRRRVALDLGGFWGGLGRSRGKLLSNEERLLFYRIHRQGGRVVYAPEAVVRHVIGRSRLSAAFFLRRGYAQGISDFLFTRQTQGVGPSRWWHVRQMAVGVKRAVVARRTPDHAGAGEGSGSPTHNSALGVPDSWHARGFLRLVHAAHGLGYMVGAAGAFWDGAGRRDEG